MPEPTSKIFFSSYDFLLHWCQNSSPSFSQKCLPHMTRSQSTIRNISYISRTRICCYCLSLDLGRSSRSNTHSKNLFLNSLGVKVSQLNQHIFKCYLAVPRPSLGHSQGGSLTNPILITAF